MAIPRRARSSVRGPLIALFAVVLGLSPALADDQPHLLVQFRIVNGRFAVDPNHTTLDLSDPAKAGYALSHEEIRVQLIDKLDSLLANGAQVLSLAGATCPDPPSKDDICNFSSKSWEDAQAAFATWAGIHKPEIVAPTAYLSDIFGNEFVGAADTNGPKLQTLIDPTPFQLDDSSDVVDYGKLNFTYLQGPIQDGQIAACDRAGPGCIVTFGANAGAFDHHITARVLAQSLKPLRGEIWDIQRIYRQLGDLLALTGIQSTLDTKDSDGDVARFASVHSGDENTVVIDGPPRLSVIAVALGPGDDDTTLKKILFLLLPEREYRKVVSNFAAWVTTRQETLETGKPIQFRELRFPERGAPDCANPGGRLCVPYINHRDLNVRLASLTALGYQAALWPDTNTHYDGYSDTKWARLRIVPADDSDAKADQSAAAGPPAAAATPAPAKAAADNHLLKYDQPRHFLSIGGGMQTNQPATFFVEYRQNELLGDDAVTIHLGWHSKSIISGNYTKDFLDFAGLGRRLAVTLTGDSDNNVSVPVGTERADERRTGGGVTLALDLFRDLDRHSLQLNGSFSYQEVALDPVAGATPPVTPATEQISSVVLGATYKWQGDDTINLPDIDFEPAVTTAWGSGATRPYWKTSARGVVHDKFENFFEYDLRAGLDWASAQTPQTELPRFGGEETLRGLKLNAAAGTFVWYAQNELWVPLRFIDRLAPEVDGMFRNALKLAVFVDVGGASNNLQGLAPFSAGAGLGLRYSLQDQATLRLDWAHLITGAPHDLGGQGIYFSIVLTPSRI
ncbi:MAG TPA: ShlB/FhaC/HecB family hemolysin secretion/activation protein [Rhizomicrobium sp.]